MKSKLSMLAVVAFLLVAGTASATDTWGNYAARLGEFQRASQSLTAILNELPAQTRAFEAGMASQDSYRRYAAKQNYLNYLARVQQFYRNAMEMGERALWALQQHAMKKGVWPEYRTHALNLQNARQNMLVGSGNIANISQAAYRLY